MLPSPQNIALHLDRQATERPTQRALCIPGDRGAGPPQQYVTLTFAELAAQVRLVATNLQQQGWQAGDRTVLMVPPSREFFVLTFALFRIGAIPVFVDPGMGLAKLGQCLQEAAPVAFIGVTKAHLARLLLGWGRRTVRRCVTIGSRWGWGGCTWADLQRTSSNAPLSLCVETDTNALAAILFTSGSTGIPKGACYTHRVFSAQIAALQEMLAIEPGETDLCTFPLFALFAPALGMTAIIPRMDFTRPAQVRPGNVFGPVQAQQVTNLFGSPALLDRLASAKPAGAAQGASSLKSLRRVLSAGAPVSPRILRNFQPLLGEHAQIFTPYGATEALPVAWIGSREILGETASLTATGAGTCVGRPAPGIDVRIIRLTDDPLPDWSEELVLPPGTIGEIAVCGPQVTREYFARPQQTRLSKIIEPDTERWWHRMGDVGYFDAQGRLWFCGRKSQRVELPQTTLWTDCCEGIFNAHPLVYRSALVAVKAQGAQTASEAAICIEGFPLRRGVRERRLPSESWQGELWELAARFEATRPITRVLLHPGFPVDIRHNSKIFREKLAQWASQQIARHPALGLRQG